MGQMIREDLLQMRKDERDPTLAKAFLPEEEQEEDLSFQP